MPDIMPATAEMIKRFWGRSIPQTVHALAAGKDGQVLGVWGYYVKNGRIVVFAGIDPQARNVRNAKIILRCGKELMEQLSEKRMPINAAADPEIAGSERLLEHLGFQRAHKEIYQWPNR